MRAKQLRGASSSCMETRCELSACSTRERDERWNGWVDGESVRSGCGGAIQLESGLTADFLNLRCASTAAAAAWPIAVIVIGSASPRAADTAPRSSNPARRAVRNLKFIALLMQRK